MTRNLIAELVKIGIDADQIVKAISKDLNISESATRNKINGTCDWKLEEAWAINDHFFDGTFTTKYLFAQS